MDASLKANMRKFFKSLVRNGSGESSKSFGLVVSAIMGAIMTLAVTFVLVWDVVSDGTINTDLTKLGIFVLCIGCYTFGSGANKMLSEVAGPESDFAMRRRMRMSRKIKRDNN